MGLYKWLYPDDCRRSVAVAFQCMDTRTLTIAFDLGWRLEVLLSDFLRGIRLENVPALKYFVPTMICLQLAQKLTLTLNLE
jgi:hypothetical protein